jgi:RNA polymerase sigma-70 factor (ECF subfamily)
MPVDVEQLEAHRAILTGHCYRMLGSSADVEDAVQETMVRAWRSVDGFEARASLKTWLYRIATNICLDLLTARARRTRPMDAGSKGTPEDVLHSRPRTHWLEPIPDAAVVPPEADPFEQAVLRRNVRLAFVSALQHLPPRQRAALLLADVVGLSASEVAECLESSVASVNSALQRARATLAQREVPEPQVPLSAEQQRLLERYVDAFARYDVDDLVSLMREDATLSMPPFTLWLQGQEPIRAWLAGRGAGCRGSVLVPTDACGTPAFAQYRPGEVAGTHQAWALVILELADERISAWNSFLDVETLFPMFGLPLTLVPALTPTS